MPKLKLGLRQHLRLLEGRLNEISSILRELQVVSVVLSVSVDAVLDIISNHGDFKDVKKDDITYDKIKDYIQKQVNAGLQMNQANAQPAELETKKDD